MLFTLPSFNGLHSSLYESGTLRQDIKLSFQITPSSITSILFCLNAVNEYLCSLE